MVCSAFLFVFLPGVPRVRYRRAWFTTLAIDAATAAVLFAFLIGVTPTVRIGFGFKGTRPFFTPFPFAVRALNSGHVTKIMGLLNFVDVGSVCLFSLWVAQFIQPANKIVFVTCKLWPLESANGSG